MCKTCWHLTSSFYECKHTCLDNLCLFLYMTAHSYEFRCMDPIFMRVWSLCSILHPRPLSFYANMQLPWLSLMLKDDSQANCFL